jgi:tRNA G10  N-methylase Trm11
MATFFQLGQSADLSFLELEALVPGVERVAPQLAALSDTIESAEAKRLIGQIGGTVRIMESLGAVKSVVSLIAVADGPQVRDIGLSSIGLPPKLHQNVVHEISRHCKQRGGARIILPLQSAHELTAAQVLGNRLERHPRAVELVAIQAPAGVLLCKTLAISNPDEFAERDRGIPRPDAKNGMLPPKLALMMVNCATQGKQLAVYDPFCGSGRILLEAAALGHAVYGSDIAPLQVKNAQANLTWLAPTDTAKVWEADATRPDGAVLPEQFCIVTEPYLGEPRRQPLPPQELRSWSESVYPRIHEALAAWSRLPHPPVRICLVLPAPMLSSGVVGEGPGEHLVDRFPQLGYALRARAWYARTDALVHRCIVILEPVKQ